LVANFLQVPSYVSFQTALAHHEVTTQVQRDYIESAALKRSRRLEIQGVAFCYHRLQPSLYFGFERRNGVFVATKEKAFLDAAYLHSFGRYGLDFSALDTDRLDKAQLGQMLAAFPPQTVRLVEQTRRILFGKSSSGRTPSDGKPFVGAGTPPGRRAA
jgi:hypothetical protein